MPAQLNDPVLVAFQACVSWLSIGTCLSLLALRTRGPLLKVEPRRPVPWNVLGALPAFMFVLLAIGSGISSSHLLDGNVPAEGAHDASHLAAGIGQELVIVGSIVIMVVVGFKASRSDMGLPASCGQFARDVGIGLVAGLAALVPVYAVMICLSGPDAKSGHPLVKMLESDQPDFTVLVLATLMAVVVAPICEEITFRLLLQGWLERREVAEIGSVELPASAETSESQMSDSTLPFSDEAALMDSESASASLINASEPRPDVPLEPISTEAPPSLPFGWVPIVISSLLFGLAHFGYGPDPVPLFLLALVLGYLYHRTHRILPSIVAHALFNGVAMFQLWWMVTHHAN